MKGRSRNNNLYFENTQKHLRRYGHISLIIFDLIRIKCNVIMYNQNIELQEKQETWTKEQILQQPKEEVKEYLNLFRIAWLVEMAK